MQIAGHRIQLLQLLLERGGDRAQHQLAAEAVPDGDQPQEIARTRRRGLRGPVLIAVYAVESVEELAHIGFGNALRRALAPPEAEVVQPAGQGPGAPAEIDADQAKVLRPIVSLTKSRARQLLMQASQRLLESLDIVVATLRGVVPAMDEQDHEGVLLLHRLPHGLDGLGGLARLIEPALIVRFDELQRISVVGVYDLRCGVLAIGRGIVVSARAE